MAKITFLGTASSIPTAQRDNTSFIFQHKKETFLIDCPGSVCQKLLKTGLDYKKVNKLIITHHHPDHIYGIISFIHAQGHINNKPVTVFSNITVINLIKRLLRLFELNKKHYPKMEFIDVLEKPCFFDNNGLRLEALKNKHAKGSFGIKFTLSEKKMFYSSDTAFYPAMLNKIKKLNLLIHDCTASSVYFKKHPSLFKLHTNSNDLAGFLEKNKNIFLVPVHFLLLEKGEMARIKRELSKLGTRVIYPKDYGCISL
ncbi:MAG: ribonuclease Z [Candidatus Omnitrophica bacterium]|nr:ribonuclease Z [Candidatus Omnitrophota bacterium]